MDVLRWVAENFQLWIAGLCIALIPVWVWYLTRKDQMARAHVETTRHRWESTFETEFQKAHFKFRLVCSVFIAILVISAMVIVCAHVLVR